ncbi:SMI1/KNR4 family protein [Microbispora sp. NPDC004025]
MHDALNKLIALVPPPAEPIHGETAWEAVFAELGTSLPADFVALVDRYGSCYFGEWLSVADPRSAAGGESFADAARYVGDQYREFRKEWPSWYPLAAWPEPGGFLKWGSTDNSDLIGWLTEGEPEAWPVIIWPRHHDQGPAIRLTATEFLLEWFSGNTFGRPELPDLDEVTCEAWG